MAITGPAITSAILGAGPDLAGPLWAQLALATGSSVAIWAKIPTNVVLNGTVLGPVGTGVVAGKFALSGAGGVGLLTSSFFAAGLQGPLSPSMAKSVALGVALALNLSATYQGVSTGAVGPDLSVVSLANPATLISLLVANLAAGGVAGPIGVSYAVGVGNGVAAMVRTGSGVGTATGIGGPVPGIGVSVSKLA
jgi:hypothetical protein